MTALGYQLSSLKPLLTSPRAVRDALERLRGIGYRILQLQWISPDVPDEAVAEALRDTGMTCIGVQDRYPAIREQWSRFLRQNDLWGGKDLCISGIPPENLSQEGILAYARELRGMEQELMEHGMTLSFHPIHADYAKIDGVCAVERLMSALPSLRLTLCIYHVCKAGLNPISLLERYRGRIDTTHFKDSAMGTDGKDFLVPTGQGQTDWPTIFETCQRTGVRYGLAEQERWNKDPYICAEESYDYIRSYGIR